jgi:lipopolysaccharide transport system permease protein
MSVVAAHLVNLAAGLILVFAMVAYYRVPLDAHALWVVPSVAVALALALGVSLILSMLNVYTRDVASLTPVLLQLWFFATPVIYPVEIVEEALEGTALLDVYLFNPMVGVVESMRAALILRTAPGPELASAAALAGGVLALGALAFTRTERTFADVI